MKSDEDVAVTENMVDFKLHCSAVNQVREHSELLFQNSKLSSKFEASCDVLINMFLFDYIRWKQMLRA